MKENSKCGEMAGEQSEEKIMELNDIYEYDVVSILDKDHGGVDTERMSEVIAFHASKGWRLVFAFSNEIGHDSSLSELGGVSIGINSTIDQNVLIFERCVKRYNR
ncbi:MAG: DUF4177 domain-containing protein [Lachnospiraceae bacterium]|jgi:hypothetical protein|nr:DUF4177 domain-containing protein [Lachnospiraceae bacterium]